jgi:peptidylprolyl isomerase domain and WD repeat-containing protein 1
LQQTFILVTDSNTGNIAVIDESLEDKDKIVHTVSFHTASVRFIKYANTIRTVVSMDLSGKIELWDPVTYDFPKHPSL